MAEPEAGVLAGFATIDNLAVWSQVSADNLVLFEAKFGCARGDGFLALGSAAEADFNAEVDAIRTAAGDPLSFTAKHSLRLLGRVARLATGADLTRVQIAARLAAVPAPVAVAPAAAPV